MSGIGKVLISPLGHALGLFKKPKVDPQIQINRNAQMEARIAEDDLRRRRGAGANELTGGGAEAATPGGKTLLGQ